MPPVQGIDDDEEFEEEEEEELLLFPKNCPAADATRIAGAWASPGRSLTGLRSSRRSAMGPP